MLWMLLFAAPVEYDRDVRPLLARACFGCHGPEKQRGGLRLDRAPTPSRVVRAVAEGLMPPGRPLKADEVALLRAWADQQRHWAFVPLSRPNVPPGRHPIDALVLARLAAEKVEPSPPADRVTLLRRVSLDLTGLPPTPEEADAFQSDDRPDAYERAVDRLLSSPHYGERWARHWLDAARYADSDGFEKDSARPHAWRYRHWVIEALNRNLRYDQFVVEQLAGDLLPGSTAEQKIATGFHRNTLTNKEGGVDREQFRVEAVVDRVNTTARAFLGLTLACAQCHDHKYDPLSQKEYYQLFAFFNSDEERDLPAQTIALGKPRKTRVMERGDFLRPGVEVRPGVPAAMPPLSAKEPTRLDLARWVADGANPLTARVAVNQAWYHFFGRGLVASLDDFGTQGEKPSHPELLDWLAAEFAGDWDVKRLHRQIVTSDTYRQSSRTRLADRDPNNVLLARQTRQRLEAEAVRDQLLFASGLLMPQVGGPSVRPPQPAGISELTYAGSAKWAESVGTDRHRRGLYTWFQRTSPHPMLMTFDAPDSNTCAVKREKSNTPLQALTLLNDVAFVECARALGRRVRAEAEGDDARLTRAFRLCVARTPTGRELGRLRGLLSELRALGGEADVWMMVGRAVLNLDESITRE